MTVSQYIIQFLSEKNVKTVFAYPGANVLRLYGQLCESGIRVVLTRHEQGAIHAAAGYAKSTGKTGVCLATSGPGATNLVTGIADAYLDSSPVLVITGQVPSVYIGRDAFQEADIMGITIPVTKHNYLIRGEKEIPRDLEEAWRVAKTPRQGPVLVDITSDLFDRELSEDSLCFECVLPRQRENMYPVSEAMPKLKKALSGAFRPLILAGGGVSSASASKALAKLCEKSSIPVVTTMMGQTCAHPDGLPFLGMAGMHGTAKANRALNQCDLLVAVGCRFSDRTVGDFDAFARSRTIVHCDIDPAEINKNVTADIPVCCGSGEFIGELSALVPTLDNTVSERYKIWRDALLADDSEDSKAAPFECEDSEADRPVYTAVAEYEKANPGTYIVTDVGTIQTKAARIISAAAERAFVTTGGLGTMGFGLPAAIGASFAVSDCKKNTENGKIIVIAGDGGFQMTMQELGVVRECPVDIKIIIINNSSLRMVSLFRQGKGGRYDLPDNPDFVKLAEAYGINASCAAADETLESAVCRFLGEKGSALLEVRV